MNKITCFTLIYLLLLSNSAYAYIDPGSGSFIIQMAIASAIGSFFTLKMFFNKYLQKARKFIFGTPNQPAEKKEENY